MTARTCNYCGRENTVATGRHACDRCVADPLQFNLWSFPLRVEHSSRCAAILKNQHGIVNDEDGHYVVPAGKTYAEVITIAEQVAAEVAQEMAKQHGMVST